MNITLDELVNELLAVSNWGDLALWKREHEISLDLLRKIASRVQYLAGSDARAALRLSEWAIDLSLDLGDRFGKALALRAKGEALVRMDDNVRAIEYFDEALKVYNEFDDNFES
jgi:tetratricopeptide (TPR) repeat protein